MAIASPEIVKPLHDIITSYVVCYNLPYKKSYLKGTKAARLTNLHRIVFSFLLAFARNPILGIPQGLFLPFFPFGFFLRSHAFPLVMTQDDN